MYILRIGITVSYGNSVLNFLSNYHIVFRQLLYHFTSHQQGETPSVPIFPHPHLLFSVLLVFCFVLVFVCMYLFFVCLFVCFDDSHPNQCEVVSHSIVDLHFPNDFPSLRGKQMGKQWKQCQTLFWGASKSLQMVIAAMKLKDAYSLEGKL